MSLLTLMDLLSMCSISFFFASNGSEVSCFKGTYCMAMWRGIQVAVKKLDDEVLSDDDQV